MKLLEKLHGVSSQYTAVFSELGLPFLPCFAPASVDSACSLLELD